MATPSEVQATKKCHACEVEKPLTDFVQFVGGMKAGDYATDCIKCQSGKRYAPSSCLICNQPRAVSDFDKNAGNGQVCKGCLMANPARYLKTCTECEQPRPFSDFYKQGRTNYVYPVCKKCETTVIAAGRRKNKGREAIAQLRRKHLERMKQLAYEAYGGFVCACCGVTEPSFLTLDHINDDGAAWRRATFGLGNAGAGTATYEWCKRNGYPPIFQVLCWNCQHGKRYLGVCPHRKETCRDHSVTEVEASVSKPLAPLVGDDMARHSVKAEPVRRLFERREICDLPETKIN